jgi:Flp pilus assembly protein TadD
MVRGRVESSPMNEAQNSQNAQIAKIAKWQAAVDRAPDDELARFTLARALLEAGRLAAARDEFARVVAMKDDWMMAHVLLGRACVELGDAEPARSALHRARALAIAQDHADPLIEIDELLEQLAEGSP